MAAGLAAVCFETAEGDLSAGVRSNQIDDLEARMSRSPQGLRTILTDYFAGGIAGGCLIVIDQFEELFMQSTALADRARFAENLRAAASSPNARVRLLIGLRADCLPQLLDMPDLRHLLGDGLFYLGAMSEDALRSIIVKPAQSVGACFERGLVRTILRDTPREAGALPLLAHVLHELWIRRRGRYLTHEGYDASGGVSGALQRRADAVLASLDSDRLRETARMVYLRLTTIGEGVRDARRRVERSELYPAGVPSADVDEVIQRFSDADARLIVTSTEPDELSADLSHIPTLERTLSSTVEIAHEALLVNWPTLRRWLDDGRQALRALRQITEHSRQWAASRRHDDFLYRGARLVRAEEELGPLRDSLNRLETEFFTASLDKRDQDAQIDQERRRDELMFAWRTAIRFRRYALAVSALFAVATCLAAYALLKTISERNARRQAELTTAYSLASEADAYRLSGHWYEAKDCLRKARQRFMNLHASTLRADLGLWNLYYYFPAPILSYNASSPVSSVVFSSDGKLALSGNWDNTVRLWEVETGRQLRSLCGHTSEVLSVALSRDGKLAASGGADKTIRLWDVHTGRELRTLYGHEDDVNSIAFSPGDDLIVSGGSDHHVKLWDVHTGKELRTFSGHELQVAGVAFSPDGKSVISCSDDGTIRLWDIAGGRQLRNFAGHLSPVRAVAFSPNGKTVLSGSMDTTLKLWDVASGRELRTLRGHDGTIQAVAFSPDGEMMISGDDEGALKLWDGAGEVCTFLGHSRRVSAVAFSPDGALALSGGDGRSVTPDGNAVDPQDEALKLWSIYGRREPAVMYGPDKIKCLVLSPDGRLVLSGCSDGTVRLWDKNSRSQVRILCGHKSVVSAVAFSPDARLALSGSWDKTAKVWNLENGSVLCTLSGHTEPVSVVAFSPDGKLALTGSWDKTLKIWNVGSGRELRTLVGHDDWIEAGIFSPDGKLILSGNDQTLKLWSVESGRELSTFTGEAKFVNSDTFDKHGKPAATLSRADDAPWNAGYRVKPWLDALAQSHDHKLILGASDDSTIKLWEAGTKIELCTFVGHGQSIAKIEFSPDGAFAVSGSADDTIRIWPIAKASEYWSQEEGAAQAMRHLQVKPDDPQALSSLADYYVFCREPQLAADLLRRAASCGAPVSFLAVGRCFWSLNDYSEARLQFRKARSANEISDFYLTLLTAGVELSELQEVCDDARELSADGCLENACDLLSAYEQGGGAIPAQVWAEVARLGAFTGQWRLAIEVAETAVQRDPDPEIIDTRGVVRALAGDLTGARSDFTEFVKQMKEEGRGMRGRDRWIRAIDAGEDFPTTATLADMYLGSGLPYSSHVVDLRSGQSSSGAH